MLKNIEIAINNGYKEYIATGNIFELTEPDQQAACNKARFRKNGGEVLVYKFDKSIDVTNTFGNIKTIDSVFPFFNDIKGLKAMADFLLFYQNANGEFFVVICNLKSGNESNSKNQFNAAEIFAHFIIENIKRQFKLDIEIDFVRRILFSTKLLYKFNRNDWNDKTKKHIPINYKCTSNSICLLDAVCELKN